MPPRRTKFDWKKQILKIWAGRLSRDLLFAKRKRENGDNFEPPRMAYKTDWSSKATGLTAQGTRYPPAPLAIHHRRHRRHARQRDALEALRSIETAAHMFTKSVGLPVWHGAHLARGGTNTPVGSIRNRGGNVCFPPLYNEPSASVIVCRDLTVSGRSSWVKAQAPTGQRMVQVESCHNMRTSMCTRLVKSLSLDL